MYKIDRRGGSKNRILGQTLYFMVISYKCKFIVMFAAQYIKLYVFHNRAVDIKDLKYHIFLNKSGVYSEKIC